MNRDAKIGLFAVLVLVVLVAVMWAKLAGEDEPAAGDIATESPKPSAPSDALASSGDDSLIEKIFQEQLNSDNPFESSSSGGTTPAYSPRSSSSTPNTAGTWAAGTGTSWGPTPAAAESSAAESASAGDSTVSTSHDTTTFADSTTPTGHTVDYTAAWSSTNTDGTTSAKTSRSYGSLFEDDTRASSGGFGSDSLAGGTSEYVSAFGGGTSTGTADSGSAAAPTTYNRFGRQLPEWPKTYTAVKGDTLAGIARKFYGSEKHWRLIADANKTVLPDPSRLRVGVKLTLPQPPASSTTTHAATSGRNQPTRGLPYKVKKGDTLIAIARAAYGDGTKWRSILDANKAVLPSPRQLAEGMVITLPTNP